MIETKFRAWDGDEKKMHYFSFNDLCGYEELGEVEAMLGRSCSGVYTRDGLHFSTNTNDRHGEVNPSIMIMQFTGLHDKNGKEIYEGDVVVVVSGNDKGYGGSVEFGKIGHVHWYQRYAEFCVGFDPDNHDHNIGNFVRDDYFNCIEVIGNIYEQLS